MNSKENQPQISRFPLSEISLVLLIIAVIIASFNIKGQAKKQDTIQDLQKQIQEETKVADNNLSQAKEDWETIKQIENGEGKEIIGSTPEETAMMQDPVAQKDAFVSTLSENFQEAIRWAEEQNQMGNVKQNGNEVTPFDKEGFEERIKKKEKELTGQLAESQKSLEKAETKVEQLKLAMIVYFCAMLAKSVITKKAQASLAILVCFVLGTVLLVIGL